MEKFVPFVVLGLVFVTAMVGLLVTLNASSTGAVVDAQSCSAVNPAYVNCLTPNGGCPGRYPDWKQWSFGIRDANIPVCCCVPSRSDFAEYGRTHGLFG